MDLDAAEPGTLISGGDEAITKALSISPKLIRSVTINKAQPIFDVRAPQSEHLRKAKILADAPGFRERVGQVLATRFALEPDAASLPVEKQIYAGFYSDSDRRLLDQFQTCDWVQRQELLDQVQDARLRQLGRRLVAFHAPELLSPAERAKFVTFLQERWSAPDVPEIEWMNLERARGAITKLRADASADQSQVDAVATFFDERERWLAR